MTKNELFKKSVGAMIWGSAGVVCLASSYIYLNIVCLLVGLACVARGGYLVKQAGEEYHEQGEDDSPETGK